MSQAEEIKSRLDIVEVIREYIQLKPVGVNFTARCPFHREKTPSFVVSPERQIWRCFGCQKGGDVFSFVMEIEGLSFIETLRQLAPRAGVQLQSYNPQETSVRNRLLDAVVWAVKYYHKVLLETPEATNAREYLKKRGLSEKIIAEWQIGYSRESWDDIYNFLKTKGFSEQEIFLAGLAIKKDNGPGYYNRFRGRIMFPINDIAGNPVAFTARVSPEREATEKMGKYINSPQTKIYDKSKILFGLDKAKNAIREAGAAIIVEGQMDAISAHQAGFINVVASSGTALSSDQIKLIKRYTDNILFSFDIDAAGQVAAERGVEQALAQEMNVKVIQVPGGKDPDECIRRNSDDFRQAIERAQSVVDYYFDKTFLNLDLNKIEHKKRAAAKLLHMVNVIASGIEKDAWLRRLADALEVNEQALRDALVKTNKKRSGQTAAAPQTQGDKELSVSHSQLLTESLLALTLKFPEHLSYVINQISPAVLAEELNRTFYKNLVIYYNKINSDPNSFSLDNFSVWLGNVTASEQELASLRDLADAIILLADKDFYEINAAEAKAEIAKILRQLKRKHLIKKMLGIERGLEGAEQAQDGVLVKEFMDQFKIIADEVRRLDE
ncbi:DNA primase [Candidatus Falkowbacteria bacterium CG10_big_fil_rev_8_21_14_0_10_43_11]|uniref:DNA primase n=1 Tax=Candidatus Falkowbacteria bacterium CG10_big_fil_rev_8_21_14_0_10_43_11 TaxID=1974568 RepID=A0A2M6WN39_9BACT|nr:MAG: DNA primase [Candidatus Falkowbacteria bacterium CG10_big_fil_rev_8_21_14_0_10_43_11]